MTEDVVVTGLGAITAVGDDVDSTWSALENGESGAGNITNFDASEFPQISDILFEVDVDPAEHELTNPDRMGKFTQLAVAASEEALVDADVPLTAEERNGATIGTSIGTAVGGAPELDEYASKIEAGERVSPHAMIRYPTNLASGHVSITFDAEGPCRSPAVACAAATHAIADAVSDVRAGRADVMLAGGSETPSSSILGTFGALRALTSRDDDPTRAVRPFDVDRDGTAAAEGAAVLVLESRSHARERGATPLATISGFGLSADATHPTRPPDDATGMCKAVEDALDDAGLAPADVDHVSAHATATPVGDVHESVGLNKVFGECPPVTSIKSALGHAFGASGAIGAAVAVKTIQEGTIPPTLNCENQDDDCDVPVVTEAMDADVDAVVTNAFGFGGTNGTLVVESP